MKLKNRRIIMPVLLAALLLAAAVPAQALFGKKAEEPAETVPGAPIAKAVSIPRTATSLTAPSSWLWMRRAAR